LAFSREREEMRARIRGAFSTSYLTLLSIIQGTAFAALFAKVDSLVTQHSFHAPQAVMAFGLLLLIVALWNQYLIGTMLYNWTLVLTDSILPFTFGVFEFAMILELQEGVSVLTINGLFLLMGVVGLEHQYRQARRSESAEFTAHVARGFRAVDVTSSVVIGVLLLGAAALISRFGQSTLSGLVAAGIIVAVALANLAREAHQWHLVQQRLSDMTA
jgi:hypothetical protein